MTTFQDLDWESIHCLKTYLYRRMASPLNNARGRLAIAQHVSSTEDAQKQFRLAEQNLEITLNLVRAWNAVIHVQSGRTISNRQCRQITPDALPVWLVDYLSGYTRLEINHTKPLFVHPESLYESLIVLVQVGCAIGKLKSLTLVDASGMWEGVWLRAIFEPPQSTAYSSLPGLMKSLDPDNPAQRDTRFQLEALQCLFALNNARFSLQNNTRTGEQALAALVLATHPAQQDAEPIDDTHKPAVSETPAGETPIDSTRPTGVFSLAVTASESPDQPPAHEPTSDQDAGADITDKPDDNEPILAGPVLAHTPHKPLKVGDTLPPLPEESDTTHTISGPVLASTPVHKKAPAQPQEQPPQVAETSLDKPEKSQAGGAPAPQKPAPQPKPAPAPESSPTAGDQSEDTIENAPDTLIVPPPDFRRRIKTPPPPAPDASPDTPPKPDIEPPPTIPPAESPPDNAQANDDHSASTSHGQ
ncbi:MAG: hypothetical protein JW966_01825 [Anaerolineae bacterium]|nr:hypothetical protein [Anaerolineae bacterium]